MTVMRALTAAMAALALTGLAATAHAQASKAAPDFTVRADTGAKPSQFGLTGARKVLKWDAQKGRWGLKLDVDQSGRDYDLTDVEAGAYFKVTPSLRVGGAVGIAENDRADAVRKRREDAAPRVRLETAFKF